MGKIGDLLWNLFPAKPMAGGEVWGCEKMSKRERRKDWDLTLVSVASPVLIFGGHGEGNQQLQQKKRGRKKREGSVIIVGCLGGGEGVL